MKKLLTKSLTIFVILIIFSCSKDDDFYGSGNLTTQIRDVSLFSKVYIEGVFTVNILQGPVQSLEVIADDNIINRLKTTVSNGELMIYLSDGSYDNITVEVNITIPNLNELVNEGTGNVSINELNNDGNLKIENSGTGDIFISGTTNTMDIKNVGSGTFYCSEFISANTEVEIIGSGDCRVYCTNTLDVIIEGSGSVYYKGNPTINVNISGSGSVIDDN